MTTGYIGKEDDVLVVQRIDVTYYLEADESDRETIDRVNELHAEYCPVARSIQGAIEVNTEYVLE